jgi:CRISPR/Cas system-associated protein endoribonuclease Cas2
MLPYNQIGIIANREIIDVRTFDNTFFFRQNIWDFFFPLLQICVYIYIIFEKKLTIFNIKRLKKTHPKKKKKKQTLGCT